METFERVLQASTIADAQERAGNWWKFIDYALSDAGQEHFAAWGYRPVNAKVLAEHKSEFPEPSGLFTIEDLGGWSKVNDAMFDPEKGSIAKIEADAGVSTAK